MPRSYDSLFDPPTDPQTWLCPTCGCESDYHTLDGDGAPCADCREAERAHAEAVERAHDALCDVCDALRQDERADPLPIARLLAQCAKMLSTACPWCGGGGYEDAGMPPTKCRACGGNLNPKENDDGSM